ncbi:unnamed protein product [Echinostoma caproni]|uniref:DUF3592 domain-containing protein n=1 Tax=Echinostoma caproni TaxID=27848 RepID=A0A183ARI1_9TREM|nr:unnamed protein product [Echinostoma caproni]
MLRIIIGFICLVAFACLGYRLADWFARYRAMKGYFVYTGPVAEREDSSKEALVRHLSHKNASGLSQPIQTFEHHSTDDRIAAAYQSAGPIHADTPRLTVTLCNLNPMRHR